MALSFSSCGSMTHCPMGHIAPELSSFSQSTHRKGTRSPRRLREEREGTRLEQTEGHIFWANQNTDSTLGFLLSHRVILGKSLESCLLFFVSPAKKGVTPIRHRV